uniref:Uncharacterized protein n=1 Tax=Haemonchus contortus TaxID=6289 RepID=A0A7I5E5G3_HAECO
MGSDHRLLCAEFRFDLQCVERKLRSSGNEAPRLLPPGITSLPLRVNGKISYRQHRKAGILQVVKRRLSSKTLELIRQRGIARAAGNNQLTSEIAKLCSEAIKEDLKERRAAVMDEAAETGKSIRKARRSFTNFKIKMTSSS